MSALPVPRRVHSEGVLRTMSDRRLRVDASACPQILPAASDLARRAYDLDLIADRARPEVTLALADIAGPPARGVDPRPPADGADPRAPGRAGASEAYRIETASGRIRVTAAGDEGLFRGLTTLLGRCGSELPASDVDDGPMWAWRGLSLDVSRRWFPVDEIERIIDLLALLKMNVLHLHLTDVQGWRFPVPGYGGAEASDHYSRQDLHRLERYARDRFVVIVPEIDVPGHVAETLAGAGVPVAAGAHPILTYLDASDEGIAAFLRAAFATLAEAFSSPWIHLGGDEAFGASSEAYRRTVACAAGIVRELGRRPIGWQEAVRSGALGEGDLVQLWISDRDRFDADKLRPQVPPALHPMLEKAQALFDLAGDDPARIADSGAGVIVSSSDPFYLDRRPRDPEVGGAGRAQELGNPGYDPMPTTAVLDGDPVAVPTLAGLPLAGIEAALWCESVRGPDDVAALLLPRLGLIAQRAWGEASRTDVLDAVRADASAWRRLGFGAFHRSSEIFSDRTNDE